MYICQDFNGNWFVASENLEAALDRETVRSPVNVAVATHPKAGHGIKYCNAQGAEAEGTVQGTWVYSHGKGEQVEHLIVRPIRSWEDGLHDLHIDPSTITILEYAHA